MKNIVNEYKKELRKIFNNKLYMFSIILTAILGYGYLITHTTIGIDDTCLDRYYGGLYSNNNMIALGGRWGSYFFCKLLNLTNFTPFWTELLTIIMYVFTAIIISCFINKNFSIKNNLVSIIFSCIYISYSLINEALIFQPSNIALIFGNLLTIISAILIYEGYSANCKKKEYILPALIFTLGISMYESCCQTFLVAILFCSLYNLVNKKQDTKNILKFLLTAITILICSIILNYFILYLFYFIGVPNELAQMAGEKQIDWLKYGLIDGTILVFKYITAYTVKNIQYFPVLEFVVATVIGLVLSIYYSIKNKDTNVFNIYIVIVLSNFALSILQCTYIMYRTCTSWSLFVAGVFTVTYTIMSNKKHLKTIAIVFATLLVLWQTRDLNQWFYSEYIKYQRDLKDAYQIADDIKKYAKDVSKPIVFAGMPDKGFQTANQIGAQSNGLSVVWWGQKAFNDNSYELIKFINSLGYRYRKPTDEQYEKGKQLAEELENYPKEGYVKEFEDIIVVKFRDI